MKYSCKCQTCLSKMEMKLAGLAWFYVLSWGWFCSSSVKFKVSFIVPQSDSCKSVHLEVSAVNLWEKSLRRFASTVVVYAHKEQWQCKQLQVMLLFMQSHCSILCTVCPNPGRQCRFEMGFFVYLSYGRGLNTSQYLCRHLLGPEHPSWCKVLILKLVWSDSYGFGLVWAQGIFCWYWQ